MAAPNTKVIKAEGPRIVHRRALLTIAADGTASEIIRFPGPGRVVAVQYGAPDATNRFEPYTALTSGTLTLKAGALTGDTTILTDATLTAAQAVPLPVGTTAVDEARGVTAATDAFGGGFPVKDGAVLVQVAGGTDTEVLSVDIWFKVCTFVQVTLTADSGADGSAVSERKVRLNRAGILAAIALDFTSMPATTDVVIEADDPGGPVLFTSTDSATDLAASLLGRAGGDEAADASAATDGTEAGNCFMSGLVVSFAQGDAFTTGDEKVVVDLYIDD